MKGVNMTMDEVVTAEDFEEVSEMTVKFFIEGICTGALGLFGIFGNIISIKVLSSRDLDMLPSFRHLLKMLAGFDATFLIFTLSLFCFSSWSNYYDDYIRPVLTPYWLPVIQIALTGSVWTTMMVSVERYLTVCLSYRSPKVQHMIYTFPIIFFAFLFNIPRFFELTTGIEATNVTIYNETLGQAYNVTIYKPVLEPTEIRRDPLYSRYYVLIANSFALAFIPMTALVILNACIFRTISKATRRHNAISSNQRRDHSVALMLISVVVVFIICHSIRSIINTYECIQMAMYGELKHWPGWIQTMVHVNHFALVVNSSINILIYACKDDKFQHVLLVTIGVRSSLGGRRSYSSEVEMTHIANENALDNRHGAKLNRTNQGLAKTRTEGGSNLVFRARDVIRNGKSSNAQPTTHLGAANGNTWNNLASGGSISSHVNTDENNSLISSTDGSGNNNQK